MLVDQIEREPGTAMSEWSLAMQAGMHCMQLTQNHNIFSLLKRCGPV